MKEIARIAGMSTMTVSRVMGGKNCCSQKTREKIEKIATKLGYFPNILGRSLVLDRLNTVGVVIPNIIHAFFPRVVNAIEERLADDGFNIFLCCSRDNPQIEASKVKMLLGHRVAGIIMLPSLRSKLSAESAKLIVRQKCPLVLVDRMISGIESDSVGWKSEEAMEKIVAKLVDGGRRRIAYFCGESKEWEKRGRTQGLMNALKSRNMSCFATVNFDSDTEENIRKKIEMLFSGKDRPDAICCATDIIADQVLPILLNLGINIPQDLALSGFGGIINTHNSKLRITTVTQDAEVMGRTSAELILKRIKESDLHKEPSNFEEIRLPMEVEFNESTL